MKNVKGLGKYSFNLGGSKNDIYIPYYIIYIFKEKDIKKCLYVYYKMNSLAIPQNLDGFLYNHRTTKAEADTRPITHTRIGDEKAKIYSGSYHIPDSDLPLFYKFYLRYMNNGVEEFLTEKQLPHGGCIYVDIDFRYDYSVKTRQHTYEDLELIIQYYLDGINELLDLTDNRPFRIFLMQKKDVNRVFDKKITKDGVHIIFAVQMSFPLQRVLRQKVLDRLNSQTTLKLPLTNNWDSVLDEGLTKGTTNAQLMLSNKPHHKRYLFNRQYTTKMESNALRFNETDDETFILLGGEDSVEEFEPLTVRYANNPVFPVKYDGEFLPETSRKIEIEPTNRTITDNDKTETMELFVSYINEGLLDDVANGDYSKGWRDVAFAFFTEFDEDYANSFIHLFSQRATTRYCPYDVEEFCKGVRSKGFGLGTIIYHMKKKNELLYNKTKMQFYNRKIDLHSKVFTSGMIADYFKNLNSDKFLYSCNQLYTFNGVYWEKDDIKHSKLVKFFDKQFLFDLTNYAQKKIQVANLALNVIADTEEAEKKTLQETIKSLTVFQTCVNFLRKGSKRKEFIDDILIVLTDNKIEFDKNPYLFAFNNKIYDLKLMDWSRPNASDYVSITTGYDYDPALITEEKTKELDTLIVQMLPDKDVRDYYMTLLSTTLVGIQMQNIIIANGVGGNGKSVLHSLTLSALGNYGYAMPSNCLLTAIKAGGNPELACLHKKRGVFAEEPSKGRFCSATVKELTGNPTLPVRNLYQNTVGIQMALTLFLGCNTLPKFDEIDMGVSRRLRVVEFVNRFVCKEDYDKIEDKTGIYLQDSKYASTEFRDDFRLVLFEMLLDYYAEFKETMVLPPQPIKCAEKTREHLAMSDGLYDWFCDKFEKDVNASVSFTDIYRTFKESEYYEMLNKTQKRDSNMKTFKCEIDKNIFLKQYVKPRGKSYSGKQLTADSVCGWKLKPIKTLTNHFVDIDGEVETDCESVDEIVFE